MTIDHVVDRVKESSGKGSYGRKFGPVIEANGLSRIPVNPYLINADGPTLYCVPLVIGEHNYMLPTRQEQRPMQFDFDNGKLIIYGEKNNGHPIDHRAKFIELDAYLEGRIWRVEVPIIFRDAAMRRISYYSKDQGCRL